MKTDRSLFFFKRQARNRRRRWAGERGSELIEMAAVMPLLFFVGLGIADFGFLMQRFEILTNGAREGVRIAVIGTTTEAEVQARVQTYVADAGLPTSPGNPVVAVSPATITANGNTWPGRTVNVSYSYPYLFMGPFAGWFGGSFGNATLQAQATMRTAGAVGGP